MAADRAQRALAQLWARLPSDSGEAPVLWFALTLALAVLFALLLGVLIGAIVRRVGRRWPVAVEAARSALGDLAAAAEVCAPRRVEERGHLGKAAAAALRGDRCQLVAEILRERHGARGGGGGA